MGLLPSYEIHYDLVKKGLQIGIKGRTTIYCAEKWGRNNILHTLRGLSTEPGYVPERGNIPAGEKNVPGGPLLN